MGQAGGQGGSLFGGTAGGSTSTATGGLFGAATQTGGSGAPATGGLFGGSGSTGGLFGAKPASGGTGGLFGATTSTTGGLFGGAGTSTGGGGLFGAAGTTGGVGLFGGPAGAQAGNPTLGFGKIERPELYIGPDFKFPSQQPSGIKNHVVSSSLIKSLDSQANARSLNINPSVALAAKSTQSKDGYGSARGTSKPSDGATAKTNKAEVTQFKPLYEYELKKVENGFDTLRVEQNPYCNKEISKLPPELQTQVINMHKFLETNDKALKKLKSQVEPFATERLVNLGSNIEKTFTTLQQTNIKLKQMTQRVHEITEHIGYFKDKMSEFQTYEENMRAQRPFKPKTEESLSQICVYLNLKLGGLVRMLDELAAIKTQVAQDAYLDPMRSEESQSSIQSLFLCMQELLNMVLSSAAKVSRLRQEAQALKQRLGITNHQLPRMQMEGYTASGGMLEEQLNPTNTAVQGMAALLYR